jgi:hypothetical protein
MNPVKQSKRGGGLPARNSEEAWNFAFGADQVLGSQSEG